MKQALATTRLTIELSEKQKQQLKVLAAVRNLTIKDFIIDCTIGHKPNKETLKSFDDYQKKIGLTKHKNFESFWKGINK